MATRAADRIGDVVGYDGGSLFRFGGTGIEHGQGARSPGGSKFVEITYCRTIGCRPKDTGGKRSWRRRRSDGRTL